MFAGGLLTAAPNWTGRPRLTGWPVAGPLELWLLGRAAVATPEWLAPLAVALTDLFCPVALCGCLAREIVACMKWRKPVVMVMIGVFVAGNALLHREAAHGAGAA